jgi:hypothetical protein
MGWPIVFRNVSARACTLVGYPGVSSVAGHPLHQVGAPAGRDTATPVRRIRLAAHGGRASALFIQTNVGVWDPKRCHPTTVAGLRVYPPNRTASFYVPLRHQLCATPPRGSDSSVRAVVAGSTAV